MRLLDVSTLQFREFLGSNIPPYAILSHTWGTEEVDFQEIQEQRNETKSKSGYLKVKKCCEKAAAHGYKYAWVDSCCIDKRSSAELSEAINSMFNWLSNHRIQEEPLVYQRLDSARVTCPRHDIFLRPELGQNRLRHARVRPRELVPANSRDNYLVSSAISHKQK